MTYARLMIEADAADRCKRWQEAADMYTKALHVLLFKAMLPVTDQQVRHVQDKRFMCFRRVRSATSPI